MTIYVILLFLIVAVFVNCLLAKTIIDLHDENERIKCLWKRSLIDHKNTCNQKIRLTEQDCDIRISKVIADFAIYSREREKKLSKLEKEAFSYNSKSHSSN